MPMYKMVKVLATGEEVDCIEEREERKPLCTDILSEELSNSSQRPPTPQFQGRDSEISKILSVLASEGRNNVLLIGRSGVGKNTLIQELGRRVSKGEVDSRICSRLIRIRRCGVMAGTMYKGDLETRWEVFCKDLEGREEVGAPTIVVIDDIHSWFGKVGENGNVETSLSIAVRASLEKRRIKIIGLTYPEKYPKDLNHDHTIQSLFTKVMVEEPTKDITMEMVRLHIPAMELRHGVKIDQSAIDLACSLPWHHPQPSSGIWSLQTSCSIPRSFSEEVSTAQSVLDYQSQDHESLVNAGRVVLVPYARRALDDAREKFEAATRRQMESQAERIMWEKSYLRLKTELVEKEKTRDHIGSDGSVEDLAKLDFAINDLETQVQYLDKVLGVPLITDQTVRQAVKKHDYTRLIGWKATDGV